MTDEELDAQVAKIRMIHEWKLGAEAAETITALRAQLAEVKAEVFDFPDRKAMSRRIREQRKLIRKLQVESDTRLRLLTDAHARAKAERAAQIERDAGIVLKHRNNLNALTSLPPQSAAAWNIYNEIRAQAHDRSALDAMIAEARAQALREAIEAYPKGIGAILAMIENKEQS